MVQGLCKLKAQTIVENLKEYGEKYEAEKAYLHYDKPAYTAGETIWFKAYLFQGLFPAGMTKTFYLDWLDEKGNLLFHSVCPVYEASAIGQFDIPLDYKGNSIHVIGYTRWMMNFDTAFLYKKDIRIFSTQTSTTKIQKPIPSIRFFPEGGNAITGIKNKIAFKANDQWGRPIKVDVELETDNGNSVGHFQSQHDGMGYFYFVPDSGIKYYAKWVDETGEKHRTVLPDSDLAGINMNVESKEGNTYFVLTRSEGVEDNLKEGFVLGTMNQQMVFSTHFNLKQINSILKKIPVSQLPDGILTITVFDKETIPVAERIIFINNNQYSFTPHVSVNKPGLEKRALNEILIDVSDTLIANLSLSVVDASFGRDSSENIFSSLLMTADIRGTIHNPAYYFSNTNDSVKQHLDLVMLTNGWRRINWFDLKKNNKAINIKQQRDIEYLVLSGSVNEVRKSKSTPENLIMLVRQSDSSSSIVYAPIDQQGSFKDTGFVFFNTMDVFYQFGKSSIYKFADIDFMKERLQAMVSDKKKKPNYYNPFFLDSFAMKYKTAFDNWQAFDEFKGKILETVTVRTTIKSHLEILEEKYTNGLFKGSNSRSFDLISNPPRYKYQELLTFLRQQVSAIWLNDPVYYIDEMLVDKEIMNSFYVSDVAYIKTFPAPFWGNSFARDRGAIAIYLRDDLDVPFVQGKGMGHKKISGYSEIREFYSPNYSAIETKEEKTDLRTTLLWEPMILTEPGNSKKIISFYNNDVTKRYRIIIEGFNKDGKLAHFEKLIE